MTDDFIDNPREVATCDRCGELESLDFMRFGVCHDCREDMGS